MWLSHQRLLSLEHRHPSRPLSVFKHSASELNHTISSQEVKVMGLCDVDDVVHVLPDEAGKVCNLFQRFHHHIQTLVSACQQVDQVAPGTSFLALGGCSNPRKELVVVMVGMTYHEESHFDFCKELPGHQPGKETKNKMVFVFSPTVVHLFHNQYHTLHIV